MTRRSLAVLAIALACAAACSEADAPTRPPAAEPAQAPSVTTPPAGQVVRIAPDAEGMVADPVTHTVAVVVREPPRLALVDGRTGEFRREVPLPGRARHLQLAAPGGPVLVPVEGSDELVTIGLPDGRPITTATTGDFPHDAPAAANGLVFVANEFGGSVVALDGDEVVATFEGFLQPGGLAAAGDLIGMVDVSAYTLTVLDAASRRQLDTVAAGDGPTHVVTDRRGRFVVADTRGDAILVFEARPTLRRTAVLDLLGAPYGMAYDAGADRLWVTLTARNEVVGLDLASGTPVEVARIPTVRQPNTVAVDSDTGRVIVASRTDGTLQLIDPSVG